MVKKIIAGILAALVLILAAFKLFYNKDNAPKKIMEVRENLTSYHMEGNMEMNSHGDKRDFLVVVDYKKDGENDLFRISLFDKNINQEQIMLRNKEGVYVLTPSLNQVYSFKGDYPLNSQKPYLYHSMLQALDGDYNIEKVSDGYLLSFTPKYENSPTWVKEDVKLSSDFKPVWVNIYDNNNSIVCAINFTKVEFGVDLKDDDFPPIPNLNQKKKEEKGKEKGEYPDILHTFNSEEEPNVKANKNNSFQNLFTMNGNLLRKREDLNERNGDYVYKELSLDNSINSDKNIASKIVYITKSDIDKNEITEESSFRSDIDYYHHQRPIIPSNRQIINQKNNILMQRYNSEKGDLINYYSKPQRIIP